VNTYNPDFWVVLKIANPYHDVDYRVLGAWGGSYLYGNSWRLNSGIVSVEDAGDCYNIWGSSGSRYVCNKERYGLKMASAGIYQRLLDKYPGTVMLDKDTDWLNYDWSK